MSKVQLRPPEDMREEAARQAALSGGSMNLFVATAMAARLGSQAEVERYFSAWGARTTPARAKVLLSQIGHAGQVRDDDCLDAPEEQAVAQQVGVVEMAAAFFRQRAERHTADDIGFILDRVPDQSPEAGDELPEGWTADRLQVG